MSTDTNEPVAPIADPPAEVSPQPTPPEVTPVTPPVETPVEPVVAEPAAPVEPAPPASAIREAMTSRGYDASQFENEEDLNGFLLDTVASSQENQQYADFGKQVAPQYDAFLAWQQSQATPAPPAPETVVEPTGLAWDIPEDVDPRYDALLELDPNTGLYRGPADMPTLAPIVEQRNKHALAQKQLASRVVGDFPSLVGQAVEPQIAALKQEIADMQKANADYQRQQQLDVVTNQHQQEWYEHDGNGQPMIDPRTNQFIPTPLYEGTVYFAEQLRQFNPQADDTQILQLATQQARMAEKAGMLTPQPAVSPAAPTAPVAPQASPAAIGAAKRETFLEGAIADHQANRGGYQPDPSAPAGLGERPPSFEELVAPTLKSWNN